MAKKSQPKKEARVQASLTFRKNTPGDRIGSVKRMSKYEGQLYSFGYTSFGPSKTKKRSNTDKSPLLLLAVKSGNKVWRARNGKSYIYGFNLNYLPPMRRLKVIEHLMQIFEESPGVSLSYSAIRSALDLPSGKEASIFRKYDVRGSKLRQLKQVRLDTYAGYLRSSLDTRQ